MDLDAEDEDDMFGGISKQEEGGDLPAIDSKAINGKSRNSFTNQGGFEKAPEQEPTSDHEEAKADSASPLAEAKPKVYDFSLLDELFQMLNETHLEPILCGYFSKIVMALLAKATNKMLHYMLVERSDRVFQGLIRHLHQHSIALLVVEIMQTKVTQGQGRSRFDSDWDKDDEKSQEEEVKLSPELAQLQ